MELLEKVLDNNNLYNAYLQVYKNKGAAGVDRMTVEELGSYLYENKDKIKELIRKRMYQPKPVRRVEIPKEDGKKRKLGIPTVLDRTIQQAIVQVLSPIYEQQFSETSYGFRLGRSCEKAVEKLLEYFNDGYDWIVDIDLETFFDTVCHDKLISIISRTVKDGDLVSLIRKYLVSGVMEGGIVNPTKEGTPQGGNLSPLLSNIMLNELDKELEARGLKFVRYADDTVILVKSRQAAERVMESITKYIKKKLGLKVNITKSKVCKPHELKYLGFGFYYTKSGIVKPKPHLKSKEKFIKKLNLILKRKRGISLLQRIIELNYLIRGWINYFRISDMKSFMQEITQHINRKLRCVILKQWKVPKKKIKELKRLGLNEETAKKIAYSRKGLWRLSMTTEVHIAITNDRLKRRGLVFPIEYYSKVHTI